MAYQLLQMAGTIIIINRSPLNLVCHCSIAAIPELSEFLYQTGLETQYQLFHFLGPCNSGHGLSDFSPLLPHSQGEKMKSGEKAGLTVVQ